MKSVGEAMAIGRNFTEALQKALRSLENKAAVFDWSPARAGSSVDTRRAAARRSASRTTAGCSEVMDALRAGATAGAGLRGHRRSTRGSSTSCCLINEVAERGRGRRRARRPTLLRRPSGTASPTRQIAQLRGMREDVVRGVRHALGIRPVYKTVDTCAAEFAARTPYHYSSYDEETEVAPARASRRCSSSAPGPNRIGQGIEFDYSCVHASMALRRGRLRDRHGQLQPRDRLHRLRHLRPALLRAADARGRARDRARRARRPARSPASSCQLGGQTPLGLAQGLEDAGVPIVGTTPGGDPPGRGARRVRPGAGRGRAARAQARHGHVASSEAQRDRRRDRLPGAGAPVVRAGRARHGDRLRRRRARGLHRAGPPTISPEHPVLVDRFLDDAVEIDVDALYDGERALPRRRDGAHRGGRHPLRRLRVRAAADHAGRRGDRAGSGEATEAIARGRRGARPAQHPVRARAPTCSTCSRPTRGPRRTVPFVSKATAVPLAKAAARIMLGRVDRRAARGGRAGRRPATAATCRRTRRSRSRRR